MRTGGAARLAFLIASVGCGDGGALATGDSRARLASVSSASTGVQSELVASDGAGEAGFGYSVAVSGNTAVVGAYHAAVGGGGEQGAVYVFVSSGTGWTQQAELTASGGGSADAFGTSVAIDGDTILVGAPGTTVTGASAQGAVYVFVSGASGWSQATALEASDGVSGDGFGSAVALGAGTAVVGAKDKSIGGGSAEGAAYVFEGSGASWSQTGALTASDGDVGDVFGSSVAVQGTTAIVGAPEKTVLGNQNQGTVYVFTKSGTSWSQQAELVADDGSAFDDFGGAIALGAGTALIGASDKGVNGNLGQGAVYVFTGSGASWTQQPTLTATDGAANDFFGASIALSGTTAAVGAYFKSFVDGGTEQGAAYLFTAEDAGWSQQAELVAADGTENDAFGFSVGLAGSTVVVGAYGKTLGANEGQGAAYAFWQPSDAGLLVDAATDAPDDSGVTGVTPEDAAAGLDSGEDAVASPDSASAAPTPDASQVEAGPQSPPSGSGGCGCHTTSRDATPRGLAVFCLSLFPLALLARRRRPRARSAMLHLGRERSRGRRVP